LTRASKAKRGRQAQTNEGQAWPMHGVPPTSFSKSIPFNANEGDIMCSPTLTNVQATPKVSGSLVFQYVFATNEYGSASYPDTFLLEVNGTFDASRAGHVSCAGVKTHVLLLCCLTLRACPCENMHGVVRRGRGELACITYKCYGKVCLCLTMHTNTFTCAHTHVCKRIQFGCMGYSRKHVPLSKSIAFPLCNALDLVALQVSTRLSFLMGSW